MCCYIRNHYWPIGTVVSLNQSKYLVGEGDGSMTGTITLSRIASENVTVESVIGYGSANGNVG